MEEFLQQVINGLVLGSIYSLIAVGLSLIFGVIRVVQWAHGEVYMVGAFIGYYLTTALQLSYFVSLILTIVIMALFGVIMERFVFRPMIRLSGGLGHATTLGAIGLSILLLNGANIVFGTLTRRFQPTELSSSITLGPVNITLQRVVVFFVSIILIIALAWFMKKTITGKTMHAMSQDRTAASLMGIDVNKTASLSFLIGSALAGAAGILIAPIFLVYPNMSGIAVSKAFPVVVLGGLGYVEGAIFSGFILGLAEAMTAAYISSAYKDVVAFILLILVLYIKPEGLFGKNVIEKV